MYNIKPLESRQDGTVAIQLLDEPFTGMIVSYGVVGFDSIDEEAGAVLKFEYDLHDDGGLAYDKFELETRLGDILIELIEEGLTNNTLIYSGGVDASRNSNPIESDTE